jgi:hypothetical protein
MSARFFGPLAALVALFGIGCASQPASDAASSTSNETSSAWATTKIGSRPNNDILEMERVQLAVDAAGHRHAVYLGSDNQTHYAELTSHSDTTIPGGVGTHHHLALDADGNPHIVFSTSQGIMHATRDGSGEWAATAIGAVGTVDGLAIDAKGTVHIASDQSAADGTDTVTVSTLPKGESTFQHDLVPGLVAGEIGFESFALAVDGQGAEYMFLHSIHFVNDTPTASHSDAEHTYFAKRPAGGSFAVEQMAKISQAGSIAVDGSGTIHAVLAVGADDPDNWSMPVYMQRGATDSSWSAPEKIFWTGYYSSLVVDASGNVRVGFTGARADFAAYGVKSASGWTVEIVSEDDAKLPSLALDPTGKPVMAFRSSAGYFVSERTE